MSRTHTFLCCIMNVSKTNKRSTTILYFLENEKIPYKSFQSPYFCGHLDI